MTSTVLQHPTANAVPFAGELHPAWCDSLDNDRPTGCGAHSSATAHVVVTGGGYEVTDQGAAFPLLLVSGVVDTKHGQPYPQTVEVSLLGPDRRGRIEFTTAEAVQLADLLDANQPGSVAATGGFPYSAVRVAALSRGCLSLSGGLNVALSPSEAALFSESLRNSAALPVTPETFATWAQHRERGTAVCMS